ncbi:winged helix-turn-helix domain-containing protein [Pseudoalteromonas sp.]|uniref:winged helix-turn-helix domain-containing protein n=1 Tax=Pseudoalteromonas sp. TaxID=53249 RepID=UPI00356670E7
MKLLNEAYFQIENYRFYPERYLINDGSQDIKLEPKQSKILLLLAQNSGRIITRDEIEKEVWQGRIISEQAVNNKISELRKVFKDNYRDPRYLKTHSQLGYELIASTSFVESNATGTNSESILQARTLKRSNRFVLVFSLLVLVLILFTGYIYFAKEVSQPPKIKFSLVPTTTEKGQEYGLNVREDGKYIAYSHRPLNAKNWRIKVKDMTTSKWRYVSPKSIDSKSPVWFGNSDTIFYVQNINNSCSIWQAKHVLANTSHEKITDCGDIASMSPLSIGPNNKWLYFSNFKNNKYELNRLNLNNYQIEKITTPPNTSIGDYASYISPNGRYLGFLRAISFARVDLNILELATGEITTLASEPHTLFAISWNNLSSELLYIDRDNFLVSQNIYTKEVKKLSNLHQKSIYPYRDKQNNTYIVEGGFFVSDIKTSDLSKIKFNYLISSSYQDYDPVPISNDKLLFTSRRSGIPQIWIKEKFDEQQLTQFEENSTLQDKLFNQEENSLLIVRNNKIIEYDLVNDQFRQITPDDWLVESLVANCKSGKPLFTAQNNGTWDLYELSEQLIKIEHDVYKFSADCNQEQYYGQKLSDLSLINIDLANKKVTPLELGLFDSIEWQIYSGELYYLSDTELLKRDLNNNKDKVIYTFSEDNKVHSFKISNNLIYINAKETMEMKIKQLNFNE